MAPVLISHSSHVLGGSPVILWISLGGKPKWLPLKFGYHDVMRTSPFKHPDSSISQDSEFMNQRHGSFFFVHGSSDSKLKRSRSLCVDEV